MIPYAVIKTGGRQYRVSPGDSLSVEKLVGKPGDTIKIKEVLMIGGEKVLLGEPNVSGATVSVVIESQFRGEKILVFKKKRRHKYRKMRGHRSEQTRLFVSEITSAAGTFTADTKPNVTTDESRTARKAQQAAAAAETGSEEKVTKKASAKKAPAKKKASPKKKAGAKKTGAAKKAKK